MPASSRLIRHLALVAVATLAGVTSQAVPALAADAPVTFSATAVPSTLAVNGHGYGHGRGMGQFGAYGYATGFSGGPWDHSTILNHFYGGTTVGHINDNPLMAVLLKSRNAQAMVISRETGLQITGITGNPTAVRVSLRPDGQFDVQTGTTCQDTGSTPAVQVASPVRVDPLANSGDKALRLCNSDGSAIAYRGALVALATTSRNLGQEVVNVVNMDDLMKGVVPRESPASWGNAAGGAGMDALRAQAVAARSYAAAGDTRWGDLHSAFGARASTCDDQFCQVYGGLAEISSSGAITYRTHDLTNQAVDETAGEVRIKSGVVARTEFSSSTGGWTAGGAFPAVVDQGDAVSSNPHHSWASSVTRSKIETAFGLGTLTGIQVLDRNDLGDIGGRVVKIRFTGTNATVDKTGNQVRSALGLKSDWFDITAPPAPAVEARTIDTACPPSEVPGGAFGDVPAESPHRRAVDCVAWHEIALGTGNGLFSPAGTVTREQMASFVARMITAAGGSLPAEPADAFDDDAGSVHETSINQLAALGVVQGVSARTYGPKLPIDRAQVASILARAVEGLGVTLTTATDYFTDDTGLVHEPAINKLAGEGVVTGTSAGTFTPNASTRRDQMASMVARALDLAMET
jgi:SpoIID/LytB domain protein